MGASAGRDYAILEQEQAVLFCGKAQAELQRLGLQDPRRIQAEYHRVTSPARHQALQRAALDAAEAKDQDEEESSPEIDSLKHQIDRLMHIKSGSVQTSLRSASSGPLRLRKTVPNTA